MRRNYFFLLLALFATTTLFFTSCSSSDDAEGTQGGTKVASISGVAQKGQFLRGSSITIYALDHTLNATGLSYPTQTTDDLGSFTVNNVNADFIDVKANGYYYNENKGETSKSTINLQALAETNSNVNVNLLTTLAYNRIKHLVAEGSKFSDAQNRAQIEVLTALGLGNSTTANFTEMNIAATGDANGLLLAASLLIQQDRSVGDVSKLISDIAADLEDDGLLSSDLNQEIHKHEHSIYVGSVITDLISFYEKNRVENFSIPPFYKFLDMDGDGKMDGTADYIFQNIEASLQPATDLMEVNKGYSAGGFSVTETFLSTIPFRAESDASWISIEKKTIAENIYACDIVAQPNSSENRTAHVTFTDNSGKELAKYSYQQKSPDELVPQRLMFGSTQVIERYIKDRIGVNGKSYNVAKITDQYSPINFGYGYNGYYYVDVPYAEKAEKYQLYFPTDMVSMPDGYGTFKLTIPQTITSEEFPFISQRESDEYSQITNPAQIKFVTAAPAVMVEGNITYDHIILTSEKPICGSATYNINNGEVDKYTAPIIGQDTHADTDGKYRIIVQIKKNEIVYETLIPVLKNGVPVHVQCYNASGQVVYEYDTYSGYYSNGGQTR